MSAIVSAALDWAIGGEKEPDQTSVAQDAIKESIESMKMGEDTQWKQVFGESDPIDQAIKEKQAQLSQTTVQTTAQPVAQPAPQPAAQTVGEPPHSPMPTASNDQSVPPSLPPMAKADEGEATEPEEQTPKKCGRPAGSKKAAADKPVKEKIVKEKKEKVVKEKKDKPVKEKKETPAARASKRQRPAASESNKSTSGSRKSAKRVKAAEHLPTKDRFEIKDLVSKEFDEFCRNFIRNHNMSLENTFGKNRLRVQLRREIEADMFCCKEQPDFAEKHIVDLLEGNDDKK